MQNQNLRSHRLRLERTILRLFRAERRRPVLSQVLLLDISPSNIYGQCSDASDYTDPFGDRDRSPGIQNIEKMGALKAKVICR
jgi:hypothetical protein